jgi:hypothetical protein
VLGSASGKARAVHIALSRSRLYVSPLSSYKEPDIPVLDICRNLKEMFSRDSRYKTLMAQVSRMKKRKKVSLLKAKTVKSIKLGWKVKRQVQQEILQKKLAQCFLEPSEGQACIARYPAAMQPMIEDFMKKAEKQTRLYRT